MPIISAIVPKHELIEICICVLATQPVIGAEAPTLHERERSVDPWQNNVRSHLSDNARIVPVALQTGERLMAIREQCCSWLHVGVDEGLDRRSGIVGDHGEANTLPLTVPMCPIHPARWDYILLGVQKSSP